MDKLQQKKVALKIVNLNLDTETATGKLMLNLLGSIGQFEREMMKERQKDGIDKAKADGKYVGRQKTALAKTDNVLDLRSKGFGATDIAERVGISVASVYRIFRMQTN